MSDEAKYELPTEEGLNLRSYYFDFELTGVVAVDRVLHTVARAGKSYHSTADWAEENEYTQPSHVERIQTAANAAAAENQALRSTLAELVEAATFNDLEMLLAGNPVVIQRASLRFDSALAAAKSLLGDSKGEA